MKKSNRAVAAAVAIVMIFLVFVPIHGAASEDAEIDVWVLCQPDSYVNVRTKPSSRCQIAGYADCGDKLLTDGEIRKGFVHITSGSYEVGDAWISAGYIVYSEPVQINQYYYVCSIGRLACRRTIDGQLRCWADNGDTMKVYWMSEEWSVTSKGFVKTEFIEFFSDTDEDI